MNAYDKMLKDELQKKYSNVQSVMRDYRTWARAMVNGTKTRINKPEWNTAEENRLYTLAVVAELRRQHPETMTINYDLIPYPITLSDLRILQDEYIIDIFRVAHPYQLVFLLA